MSLITRLSNRSSGILSAGLLLLASCGAESAAQTTSTEPAAVPTSTSAAPSTAEPATAPGPSASTTTKDDDPVKGYVGLFGDNAVAVIDMAAGVVTQTIAVPPGPHGLVITPDNEQVFVSSDGASTVSVIDTASDTVTDTVDVGPTPHGLAMTPDGDLVLAAVFGAGEVAFVDAHTHAVVGQVPVAQPHNIAVTPDGTTAYVASQAEGAPALVVLDIASQSQTGSIPLDTAPRALNVSADGEEVFFTVADADTVEVLNLASGAITADVAVGASPHHPLLVNDELLVVSQGPGELAVIDETTYEVTATIAVGGKPHWIAASADGNTAYVTNEESGDLSVIDLRTNTVTATLAVGNGPRKIVVES